MPNKKPINPNTKYGRKQILQEARKYNQRVTPKDKQDGQLLAFILLGGLLVVILIFLFAIGGTDAITDWITPKGLK